MNIPLFKPELGKEELAGLKEIFKTGWIGLGPKTAEFESTFAKYIGVKFAVGVNSCTAALKLALEIYDFPEGSEVLMATINFISAPHSALYNNLKPVFVDVDQDTLCMNVGDLERKITKNSRAIIATHLGGTPANMDGIMRIAKKHGLIVIEDVANAVGGSYNGKMLGSIGHIGCHSFEAKKNMTTGDGGMLTLNDAAMNDRLRRLRWLGINKDTWKRFSEKKGSYGWYYEVSELGYKENMNDIMAVIGLAQLKKLSGMLKRKDALIKRYNKALKDVVGVTIPGEQANAKGAYWLYILKVERRDQFIQFLQERGITTGVHFMPMHMHPLYKTDTAKTPIADHVWQNIVSLPLYPSMTKREQDYVIKVIKEFK